MPQAGGHFEVKGEIPSGLDVVHHVHTLGYAVCGSSKVLVKAERFLSS
jgi:hypothetical protein